MLFISRINIRLDFLEDFFDFPPDFADFLKNFGDFLQDFVDFLEDFADLLKDFIDFLKEKFVRFRAVFGTISETADLDLVYITVLRDP